MAGGSGTRLHPLTKSVNKHLLPVYDKPLIYYPLTTLMLAGIREITLITSASEVELFKRLLGDGNQFGIDLDYLIQDKPAGIAEGLIIAKEFIKNHKIGFILGDNLFHGIGLGRQLAEHQNINGAHIFAYEVKDPRSFGVVELNSEKKIVSIEEKPSNPKSNLAITGLYFYDENAHDYALQLQPSARGELEITSLNSTYLNQNKLSVTVLSKGTAWLDTGSFQGLHDASSYIRIVEERQNSKIGDPVEAAKNQGWI